MSHEQITVLHLFWQQKQKIRKWEQLNCEFSCIKIEMTANSGFYLPRLCRAIRLFFPFDSYQMLTVMQILLFVNQKKKMGEEILLFFSHVDRDLHKKQQQKCGCMSFSQRKQRFFWFSRAWIKYVSGTSPKTIRTHAHTHTRIHYTRCRTVLCHARNTYTGYRMQHALSHLLFNISAPLLSPAWRGLISCFWH